MKTLAFVFCYNRGRVLSECIASLFQPGGYVPDEIVFIDDGSTEDVASFLFRASRRYQDRAKITLWLKARNEGFSDSAVRAMAYARQVNPDFLFFIESDYVYRAGGLADVMALLSRDGQTCLGVVGYDHKFFYYLKITDKIYPKCMIAQVGEDNVNRAVMYAPKAAVQLATNTCWTSYLHWRNIQKVAAEFPELNDLLDQACSPQDNPNYPESGAFRKLRCVDDGMLSHALSLCWNRWALKHGIDRETNAAWLNIRPSVAEHKHMGGLHSCKNTSLT